MTKPLKAYRNEEFLTGPDARTIRILAEYLEPVQRFNKHNIADTIVFFGSARILLPQQARKELDELQGRIAGARGSRRTALEAELTAAEMRINTSRYYEDAAALAAMITRWSKQLYAKKRRRGRRFIVCTGGGPGIMEAANRGASEENGYSVGLNVSLPLEQQPNPFISKELAFEFHYFFIRKFWFVYLAKAVVIFPGGFGTIDEMMELLTLIQTRKITKPMPIVLYGSDFWKSIINFEALVEWGMISRQDRDLFCFADTPEQAFAHLKTKLENLQ